MQRLSMILCAVTCTAAASAAAAGARYDIKGISLGATEAAASAELSDMKCRDVPPQIVPKLLTHRVCSSPSTGRSFAGQDLNVQYWIDNDRVAIVTVGVVRPDDFEGLLDTMKTKYGAPELSKTELANRMGARFTNATAHWRNAAGDHIVLERYNTASSDPLDAGALRFYSAEIWSQRHGDAGARRAAAKKDM